MNVSWTERLFILSFVVSVVSAVSAFSAPVLDESSRGEPYIVDRSFHELPPILNQEAPMESLDEAAILEMLEEESDAVRNLYLFRPLPYVYSEDREAASSGENVFEVAGVNSTDTIRRVSSITGASLELLRRRAVGTGGQYAGLAVSELEETDPFFGLGDKPFRSSADGFILEDQDFREVLVTDNVTVIDELGLTHQKVAEPIILALEEYQGSTSLPYFSRTRLSREFTFEYSGQSYQTEVSSMGGSVFLFFGEPPPEGEYRPFYVRTGWIGAGVQGSIFNDELFASDVITFTKPETEESLTIDMLTPHLIYRYGFYQGGIYRVAPREIIDFFKIGEDR